VKSTNVIYFYFSHFPRVICNTLIKKIKKRKVDDVEW
jgi:hypothetical protein